VLLLAILAAGCGGVSADRCPPLNEAQRARLQRYVQQKYELPVLPELAETPVDDSGCYRELQFSSAGRRRPSHIKLYLSPDLRFLSEELFDSTVDPHEEERRKEEALRSGLSDGDYPAKGPRDAAVTLTLFSDFQCPYCADAAHMLAADILPAESARVRLVFRHFPLDFHKWARRAAEATACAQQQGDDYFWSLHDFLFENQGDLTPANLDQKLAGRASSLAGFDQEAYRNCLANGAGRARVDQDVAFGRSIGVSGTPTLFVNTHRLKGAGSLVQIRTLIRELDKR